MPERFGLHAASDYARVVERVNAIGIKHHERLRFVEPPQGSLLLS